MTWSPDRVDLLKKLWGDGYSAGQIADRLGGVTRMAVCGKVHRMGLPTRTTRVRKSPVRRPSPPPSPQARSYSARPPAERAAPEPDRPYRVDPVTAAGIGATAAAVGALQRDHCKYPHGEPGTEAFTFCGAGRIEGSAYCAAHHARCHNSPAPRQRKKPDPNRPYTPKT